MKTIDMSVLKEIISNAITINREYASVSRIDILNRLIDVGVSPNRANRIVNIRNRNFRQVLEELCRELGYNYIVYNFRVRKGVRSGKFYFFKNLNNNLASALLLNKKTVVFKIK